MDNRIIPSPSSAHRAVHCPCCGAPLKAPAPHSCRVLPPLPELLTDDQGEITDEGYAEACSEWEGLTEDEQDISREQFDWLERLAYAFNMLDPDEQLYWSERLEQAAADHDTLEGDRR